MATKEWIMKHKERHLHYTREYAKNYAIKYPWHRVYHLVKTRCNNKNAPNYKYYGGRGIICLIKKEEIKLIWFRDKAYNMKKPSIDRIDNDKHYTFENCRFIEMSENISKRNRRLVQQVDFNENVLRTFRSSQEAAEILFNKCARGVNIGSCARGRQKTAYGYKWRFSS